MRFDSDLTAIWERTDLPQAELNQKPACERRPEDNPKSFTTSNGYHDQTENSGAKT
jgi:hypothetical protein